MGSWLSSAAAPPAVEATGGHAMVAQMVAKESKKKVAKKPSFFTWLIFRPLNRATRFVRKHPRATLLVSVVSVAGLSYYAYKKLRPTL
jgi:hypothetical protein